MAIPTKVYQDTLGLSDGVSLWSKPLQITVLPEEKVPEFLFAIPMLLICVISVIVFYGIMFEK